MTRSDHLARAAVIGLTAVGVAFLLTEAVGRDLHVAAALGMLAASVVVERLRAHSRPRASLIVRKTPDASKVDLSLTRAPLAREDLDALAMPDFDPGDEWEQRHDGLTPRDEDGDDV